MVAETGPAPEATGKLLWRDRPRATWIVIATPHRYRDNKRPDFAPIGIDAAIKAGVLHKASGVHHGQIS